MNLRAIFGSIICLFVIGFNPISALTQDDSTSQFESLILDSEKAFKSGKWTQSIALGESALKACHLRLSVNNPRCIYIMKNNSLAYEQAGELIEHADKIERAYRVALLQLGPFHHFTIKTREVFYHLAVKQKRYSETIPIVIAIIHHERTNTNDELEILNKFIELYALYKKTNQVQYEVPTLESIATLTKKTMGADTDNYQQAVIALAECYCKQKNYKKFDILASRYSLDIKCDYRLLNR